MAVACLRATTHADTTLGIPDTFYAWRKTRSGAQFSPCMEFGPAIIPPKPYRVADAVKKAYAERAARADAGYESEDERDVDESPPQLSPGFSLPTSSPQPSAAPSPLTLRPSPCETTPLPPQPSSSTLFKPGKSRKSAGKEPRARHRKTAHVKAGNKSRQQRARKVDGGPGIKAVAKKRLHDSEPPIRTDYSMEQDPKTTSPGWVACNQQLEKELYALERLTGPEFEMELIHWDGVYVCALPFHTPLLIHVDA